jgi:branched-chain amino acid transport system substrate-binding protein
MVRVASALALLACACTGDGVDVAPVNAPKPIVIGVSLGQTQRLAPTAVPLVNATHAAEVQVNALGGLFGRPVQLRVADDQSDEGDVARSTVDGLLTQGSLAILGPIGSAQVLAVEQDTLAKQVIEISPTATSIDLSTAQKSHDRYLFRTTPADDLQARAVVLYALKGPGAIGGGAGVSCKNMAVVHMDNSYGNGMAKAIEQLFPSKGGAITSDVTLPADLAGDYTAQVSVVTKSPTKPDCQALIAYDDIGAQYLSDFKSTSSGLSSNFFTIGSDALFTDAFLHAGSPSNVVEGVSGTHPSTAPPTPQYADFKQIYESLFPESASDTKIEEAKHPFASNQYDAAMLALLAIAQAGEGADGPKIRDALYTVSKQGQVFGPSQFGDALQAIQQGVDIDYKGASGDVDFNDQGGVVADYVVWQVKSGKFEILGRVPASELVP